MKIRARGLAVCIGWVAVAAASGLQDSEAPDPRLGTVLSQTSTLRPEVLEMALTAYDTASAEGLVERSRLTIIDYELASYEERLWVIDMISARLLHEEWVSHGMGKPRGSGGDMEWALSFSNRKGSRKSSLGLFTTAETYNGKHGYSLRLDGREPGVNDAARKRTIVIHSASYVTVRRAEDHTVGRSWGCPALRPKVAKQLIDAIKGGSVLWIYYPEASWLESSPFLNGSGVSEAPTPE